MESIWDRFEIDLGSIWDQFGIDLGSIWDRFGIDLASVWDRFGIEKRSKRDGIVIFESKSRFKGGDGSKKSNFVCIARIES